ncbi:sugar phosphate isomerase/epimerase [candidate division KSB1 bacterium]|nr:sugar phosphate isomerase/epimerase [candidate division KSB1 bacterium]
MNNTSRRRFIKTTAKSVALAGLTGYLAGCYKTVPEKKIHQIGLQVFTIQKPYQNDYKAALRQVAEIGYTTLELGGPMGDSLEEFLAFLKELGLRPLAGGASMSGFVESTQAVIEESLKMGKEWIICYWPWTDSKEGKTLDDWIKVAEQLNKIGEQVKKAGLKFAYHNHDLEFEITEGKIPYDILLDRTDPALVAMEIDLYWIIKGNQEPIPYFEKYPGRFPLWHVKDMDNTEERSFACVGQGIIDFPSIFERAETAGLKHMFVEHDRPEDPMECARVSFEYLNNLLNA